MALMRWKPFDTIDSWKSLEELQNEMNKLFDFSLARSTRDRGTATPAVDVYEDDAAVYIEADLPGFEHKNIKLSYRNDMLTINAAREENKEVKKEHYYRIERFKGQFQRSIPIPRGVDYNKIKAQYKNGTLKVTLPKKEKEKKKVININVE